MTDEAFLSRWARRKQQVKSGELPPPEPPPQVAPALPGAPVKAEQPAQPPTDAPNNEAPPLPTLEDVAALTRESDYARFLQPGVDNGVKQAAMKKLFFSDPHYNVMDGLDVYIGDYNTPDPLPASMLRQMVQAKFLGLFDDEEEEKKNPTLAEASTDGAARPDAPPLTASAHEDPDLQLQPDDAARCESAGGGADAESGDGQQRDNVG